MVQSPSDRLQSHWPKKNLSNDPRRIELDELPPSTEWSEWLTQCMGEHPVLTLATAAVAGLALGWIVKRK